MTETRTPLDPGTPGIRELLTAVGDGKVWFTLAFGQSYLIDDPALILNATDGIAACRRAGWVRRDGVTWHLTGRGVALLRADQPPLIDEGEGLLT